MIEKPYSLEGYKLLHDGALALADIERGGVCVDVPYLERTDVELTEQIEKAEDTIRSCKDFAVWERLYGAKVKITSDDQLAKVLYEGLGNKVLKRAKGGAPSVDDEALGKIGGPLAKAVQRLRQLTTPRTHVRGLLREQVNGLLHPSFNLHLVTTFRSSSDGPNFQNLPVRDPEQGKFVRTAIVPPEGFQIAEIDGKGQEVGVAACYHKDPAMITYITDKTLDMHRDTAAECYMLKPEQVNKKIRYCGKNGFVFPAFYGSYWKNIAPAMWDMSAGLKLDDGTPLRQHLKAEGIKNVGEFIAHIQVVDERFWGERFPVYDKWKKDWYRAYERAGFFDTLTGFRCQGVMYRNEVVNYPVQGSAFHCLLWCLIRIHRWLKKGRFRSRIAGQIHDSIVMYLHPEERDEVLGYVRRVMREDLRVAWAWIIVPLDVEIELCEVSQPWNEKKEYKLT